MTTKIYKHFRSCHMSLSVSLKRIFLIIIIPILLVLGLGSTANATADGPDFYRVQNVEYWDVLNIRRWPSHKSKIIGIIPPEGRGIENLVRYVRGWCLISYSGTDGWVNCRYLREDY